MKKMWTLKNAAVAVLGALFLGGICKLGIFFSVNAGNQSFSAGSRDHVGITKRERIVGTFFRGLYLFRADGGSVSKNRRIYQSLLETEMLFRDGKMKEVLQKAVREYEKEDAGADVSKKHFLS